MKIQPKRWVVIGLSLSSAFLLLALWLFLPAIPAQGKASLDADSTRAVQRAWEMALETGSYSFNADLAQTRIPLASISNVGRQSDQQILRMEGNANLTERNLSFTLWSGEGTVLDDSSGVQVRVEGDRAYARQGQSPWEEVPDFTASFAPQSDFMALLSGAKNVRLMGASDTSALDYQDFFGPDLQISSSPAEAKRYSFDLDGEGFSRYVSEQMEKSLSEQGKLPPGVEFALSQQYKQMTGEGEIWIGPNGLPLRQLTHIELPPGDDGFQVEADISVTFSDYGIAPIPDRAANAVYGKLGLLGGFLLVIGLTLVVSRRKRGVYATLILAVILSMVAGPPLQEARAAEFYRDMSSQSKTQEQQQQASQSLGEQDPSQIEPNTSPLETALQRQQAQTLLESTSSVPVASPYSPANSPSTQSLQGSLIDIDSDHDGLPDSQEALLGTDPFNPDSDYDNITDTMEVQGFVMNSATWYGDPMKPDTNDDGVGDSQEWGLDTDNDGAPDMWSRDNDSDAVPDNVDLSPFRKSQETFDKDHPFNLIINDLTPNMPTYVDIQVRPSDLAHIRYAYDVFAWPSNDAAGQMEDVDGKTFKDIYPDSDQPQDANGNVKLVPLLEITITGDPTNLPDKDELEKYGISVRKLKEDGSQVAAYVPLQIETDKGDHHVAFYARMFYRPATHWGIAQQVRVIWAVQALVDQCKEDGFKDGVCQTFDKMNQLELLQTYYDSFILTGIDVREDHGADFAIVYKDPSVLTDVSNKVNHLDPFENLLFGLDRSFLTGRHGSNGQRDMGVHDIYTHFDHTINASVTITDRFGIEQNIFRVKQVSSQHIDQALQQIVVTETKKILSAYTPYWSSGSPITPTLLFAHEERFRPLNLDSQGNHGNVSWNSQTLILQMPTSPAQGSGLIPVQEHTLVAMNWSPYLYKDGAWNSCPLDVFVDDLDALYPTNLIDSDSDTAQGGITFLKLFYMNAYQGYAGVIKIGNIAIDTNESIDNTNIKKWINFWEGTNTVFRIALMAFNMFHVRYNLPTALQRVKFYFRTLQAKITGKVISQSQAELKEFKPVGKGLLIAILVIIVIVAVLKFIPKVRDWLNNTKGGEYVKIALHSTFLIMAGVKSIIFLCRYRASGANSSIWDFSNAGQAGFNAMIVLTVIIAIVQTLVFIYFVIKNHVKFLSEQFDKGFSELLASIIVLLIVAALTAIPIVGPVIVALIFLLDFILKTLIGFDYIAWFTDKISYVIYGYDLMVGAGGNAGDSTMKTNNPDEGLSVGNSIAWEFPLTTTVTMTNPKAWQAHAWMELYTVESLENSSLEYKLDTITETVTAYKGQRAAEWSTPELDHHHIGHPMYRVHVTDKLSDSNIPLHYAGVNQDLGLYLNTGFSLPAIECWTAVIWPWYIPVPICYRRTLNGQSPERLPHIILDIFPKTLDDFYTWNWVTNSSPTSPIPKDHDNDGLIGKFWGGNDPNDEKWDSDGDLLSDYYEITMRSIPPSQGGAAFDPLLPDTDGDGLRDDAEVRYGANPTSADSDGDRRSDLQEVDGYQFTYASGKHTLIRSNPLNSDPDNDGMNDYVEEYLERLDPTGNPYHPLVWNVNPFPLTTELSKHEPYLSPGATVGFTATLKDQLHTTWPVDGAMTTTLPSAVHGSLPPLKYHLDPGGSVSQSALLTLDAGMPSQTVTLPTRACATLETPLVYYPFNPPVYDSHNFRYVYTNTLNYRYNAFCVPGYSECPTQVSGPPGAGTALEFGEGKRLRIDRSEVDLSFTDHQPFTLAAWVYWKGFVSAHMNTIFSKVSGFKEFPDGTMVPANGDFFLGFTPYGMIEFTSYTEDNVIDPKVVLQENWNHILVTFDGNKHFIYLNGILLDMTEDGGMCDGERPCLQPPYKEWPMMIGSNILEDHYPGIAAYFHGKLDEIYVFDRALSQREIYALSHPGETLSPENPSTVSCDLQADQEVHFVVDAERPTSHITTITNESYYPGSGTLIVGGEAHDPSSYVTKVDVSVDSESWQAANGAASWAYSWDISHVGEGPHNLRSRAADAVGFVETPSSSVTAIVDRTPPTVLSGGLETGDPNMGSAVLDSTGKWVLPLKGTVVDPNSGSKPGSGVKSVEILLKGGLGDTAGRTWQSATFQGGNWTINYVLPRFDNEAQGIIKPTGCYTLWGRGTDNVGNSDNPSQYFETSFCLDNTAPASTLTYTGSSTTTITTTVILNGIVEDLGLNGAPVGSGVSQLQVAFVPAEVADVVNENVLMMHLDESVNSQFFRDGSPGNSTGVCSGAACPVAGMPGKIDQAVQFDGVDDVIDLGNPPALQITGTTIAVAAWFKTSATGAELKNRSLVSKWDTASGRGSFKLGWNESEHLSFSVRNQSNFLAQVEAVLQGPVFNDGNWHLAIGVDMGSDFYLYVDGNLAGEAHHSGFGSLSNPSLQSRIGGENSGGFFPGMIDEVMVFPSGLTSIQAAAVHQWGEIAWNQATLTNPGAMSTAWSYTVPGNLDGVYQIDLRARDALGNLDQYRSNWDAWRGEIDTQPPVVEVYRGDFSDNKKQLLCDAKDFNLDRSTYQCSCPQSPGEQYYYQVSGWYRTVTTDTHRLYDLWSQCFYLPNDLPPAASVHACDRYGRCSEAHSTGVIANEALNVVTQSPLPISAVLTPTNETVLTSLSPISLTVEGEAQNYLKELNVYLDGALDHTFSFPGASVTSTLTSTTWSPPSEEGFHILRSSALDWNDQEQIEWFTNTLYVDLNSPTINFDASVITSSGRLPYPGVNLTGEATDAAGVRTVDVSIEGGAWVSASLVEDTAWRFAWLFSSPPDGLTYDVDARSVDLGGHVTQASHSTTVDIVAPAPITLTLSYQNSQGILAPIHTGDVISDVLDPTLFLEWTEASDGSGLRNYLAGLVSTEEQADPGLLTNYDPAHRSHSQQVQEGHAYVAYVASTDIYGNRRWQLSGPIYVDTPRTPDYALLDLGSLNMGGSFDVGEATSPSSSAVYHGWMDSDCSLVGVNRIISETANALSSLSDVQRLYTTWSQDALRLTWTGGDWDGDGDLFVYLDSLPSSGTAQAYNPFPEDASQSVSLPLLADYLVWVQGAGTAEILRWDGSQWVAIFTGSEAMRPYFRFDHQPEGDTTDLYLPFSLIEITDPSTQGLGLVAFATEQDKLRLWTVMPLINPHDSSVLGSFPYRISEIPTLPLINGYHWETLAADQCPRQEEYLDVDLRGILSAFPTGVITETRLGGLFLAGNFSTGRSNQLQGDAQQLAYKLRYVHLGSDAATGTRLVLTSEGSLYLEGGELVYGSDGVAYYRREVDLGELVPHSIGEFDFTGTVDVDFMRVQYQDCLLGHPPEECFHLLELTRIAAINASLYTASDPANPVEHLRIMHPVDAEPPTNVAILEAKSPIEQGITLLSPKHGAEPASQTWYTPENLGEARGTLGPESALSLPAFYVRPGEVSVLGTARDPAGIVKVTVQVLDPYGDATDFDCNDLVLQSDQWTCSVDVPVSNNGDRYFVHARATDYFDQTSEWSPWRVLILDTLTPTIDLDVDSSDRLSHQYFSQWSNNLIGVEVQDNFLAVGAKVCIDQSGDPTHPFSCQVAPVQPGDGITGTWSYELPVGAQMDGVAHALILYGLDAAGNLSGESLTRTYMVDTVPPQVNLDTYTPVVSLGEYQLHPIPLLTGSAWDGSGSVDVVVLMTHELSGTMRSPLELTAGNWQFQPELTLFGNYSLRVELRDLAGNVTYLGPFPLEVVDWLRYWFPFIGR